VRQCDDRAHDYLVPRGWILQVVLTELRSGTSSDTWMDPVSSSPSVLHVIGTQRVDDAGSSRYVVTTFRPAAPGKATIWSDSRNCARTILLQTSCSTGFRFEIHVDVI
jgi:hypothetical protein